MGWDLVFFCYASPIPLACAAGHAETNHAPCQDPGPGVPLHAVIAIWIDRYDGFEFINFDLTIKCAALYQRTYHEVELNVLNNLSVFWDVFYLLH